jgi:hypothetical protein
MSAGAAEHIQTELQGWPGVEAGHGRFGSVRFTLGRRELGHVHGDEIADLPLRHEIADVLIAAGRARPHRWTRPGSGWVTVELRSEEDVKEAIELMRSTYERALTKRRQPAGP